MEDENLMFNFEDIDIKEESINFITEEDKVIPKETTTEETTETEDTTDKTVDISEEKKEEDLDKTKEGTPEAKDDSSHNSTLYALAKYLKEEGVLFLDKDLEKVDTLEDLKTLISESNTKARYANLNESQKRYQEALENGIPKNEFEDIEKEIQTFTNIKEENVESDENLRFELVALDLINKGIDRDKAIKLSKLSLTEDSNIQDAKDALKNLIESKKNTFKTLVETNKTKTDVALSDIKKAIFEKDKILEMSLNDVSKSKLFDLMTTKVDSDENGRPLNKFQKWQKDNPIEAGIFVNYLYMATNEGKDLGLIKKSTTTTATKELENKLKSLSFDTNGSLIIPDEMFRDKPKPNNNNEINKLTINI